MSPPLRTWLSFGPFVLMGTLVPLLGCGRVDQVLEGEEIPRVDGGDGKPGRDPEAALDAAPGEADAGKVDHDLEDGGEVLPTRKLAQDADCDLNGVWIARQVTLSRAVGAPQYASTWYYLELEQDEERVLVRRHFDCGIEVKGTVSVKLTPATLRAFIAHNLQAGRKGSMSKRNGQCSFDMERFWSVRGADEARFQPKDATQDIAQAALNNPLPTEGDTDGAIDWEKDGYPGVAVQVTGIVSGTRNTVQRDWTEWFTDATHTIVPSEDWSDDLVARVRFNNEENVLHASNPTVSAAGTPDASVQHLLTLRFLGRSTEDARAKAIIKSDDFATCQAIQAALPFATEL